MAAKLLDALQGHLTPDVIQNTSAFLDERPTNTQRAIQDLMPALLAGLSERASAPGGADVLLNVINRVGQSVDPIELAGGGKRSFDSLVRSGQAVLGTILGGRLSTVIGHVASTNGMRQASVTLLVAMLAPVVLAVLGRHVASARLDATGLVTWLRGQHDDVRAFLPAGLASVFPSITGARVAVTAAGLVRVVGSRTPVGSEPRRPGQPQSPQ
jgi:OmpA-OmpF porin, OOP family